MATTGHLVQGFFFFFGISHEPSKEGGLTSAAVLRVAEGRAGLGGGVRITYLYLTAAAEEEGPSVQHMRF